MKILRRQISAKDGDGVVQMKTEEAEDMWHAYNLIFAGDRVRTSTVRKVRYRPHCTLSALRSMPSKFRHIRKSTMVSLPETQA